MSRANAMLESLKISPKDRLKTMSKGTKEKVQSILISTHLISDVENILDEVIFIQEGQLKLHASVEDIRMQEGESIDSYFREVFKC